MPKLAIVIPTYNEAENVERLLTSVRDVVETIGDLKVEVHVVDDSSPDGTADLANEARASLSSHTFSVFVHVRPRKEGLGAAYIDGFSRVLADDSVDLVIQMDADLSHDPKYLPALVAAAHRGADFVVASRYTNGGGCPDWSLWRRLLSRGGNQYVRVILDRKLTDYTGAFALYAPALLRTVDVPSIAAKGYGFQIELKYRAAHAAKLITEIPIVFMDRSRGQSKIPKSTLWKNSVLVLRLRLRDRHQ